MITSCRSGTRAKDNPGFVGRSILSSPLILVLTREELLLCCVAIQVIHAFSQDQSLPTIDEIRFHPSLFFKHSPESRDAHFETSLVAHPPPRSPSPYFLPSPPKRLFRRQKSSLPSSTYWAGSRLPFSASAPACKSTLIPNSFLSKLVKLEPSLR